MAGEVVAYVSMTERDIAPMQEAFKKATGLDVKVVVIPIGQATTRIKVEAGRPQADIQMGGSIDYYQELAKNDLLVPYESKNATAIDARLPSGPGARRRTAARGASGGRAERRPAGQTPGKPPTAW